jgi:hypothetical protein
MAGASVVDGAVIVGRVSSARSTGRQHHRTWRVMGPQQRYRDTLYTLLGPGEEMGIGATYSCSESVEGNSEGAR